MLSAGVAGLEADCAGQARSARAHAGEVSTNDVADTALQRASQRKQAPVGSRAACARGLRVGHLARRSPPKMR